MPEKENCSGAYPSLFMGHMNVKLKFFHRRSSGSQNEIFKESAKAFTQYFSREFCRRWGAGSPSPSGVAHQAVLLRPDHKRRH